jgi:hypothetical protein
MAKDKFDEFYESIDKEYGKSNTDKNVDYVMSLVKQREQPDGSIDDDIPAPTLQSTAEVIILVMTRSDILFEQFCEKDRGHKRVIEYVFIRGVKHRDEIICFLKQLLSRSIPGLAPKLVLGFIRLFDQLCPKEKPTSFLKVIQFPEKAKEIIDTLHFMTNGYVGKDAALVMVVAQEEGLISSSRYDDIKEEFPSIHQKAYNKDLSSLHDKTYEDMKRPIRTALRTRIGYVRFEDGRIEFKKTSLSPRNMVLQFWRWIMSFFY